MDGLALLILQLLTVLRFSVNGQECKDWSSRRPGPDDLSVMYSEVAPEAGLVRHLAVYAMLRQLRQELDVYAYMDRQTHRVLRQVFTEDSLRDVPVFEDVFCLDDTRQLSDVLRKDFQAFQLPIKSLLTDKQYKYGRVLWLYPIVPR